MGNHLHNLLTIRPDLAAKLTDVEIRLFPKLKAVDHQGGDLNLASYSIKYNNCGYLPQNLVVFA
jgi:hypothetical protein